MQLVGIGLIVLAILAIGTYRKKAQVCTEEVIAVISRIDTYRKRRHNHHNHIEHDVYVEYTYGGKSHEAKLGHYTASMDVGDTVPIYVNPLNAEEFYHKSSSIIGLIILIIIGIAFIVGGFFV